MLPLAYTLVQKHCENKSLIELSQDPGDFLKLSSAYDIESTSLNKTIDQLSLHNKSIFDFKFYGSVKYIPIINGAVISYAGTVLPQQMQVLYSVECQTQIFKAALRSIEHSLPSATNLLSLHFANTQESKKLNFLGLPAETMILKVNKTLSTVANNNTLESSFGSLQLFSFQFLFYVQPNVTSKFITKFAPPNISTTAAATTDNNTTTNNDKTTEPSPPTPTPPETPLVINANDLIVNEAEDVCKKENLPDYEDTIPEDDEYSDDDGSFSSVSELDANFAGDSVSCKNSHTGQTNIMKRLDLDGSHTGQTNIMKRLKIDDDMSEREFTLNISVAPDVKNESKSTVKDSKSKSPESKSVSTLTVKDSKNVSPESKSVSPEFKSVSTATDVDSIVVDPKTQKITVNELPVSSVSEVSSHTGATEVFRNMNLGYGGLKRLVEKFTLSLAEKPLPDSSTKDISLYAIVDLIRNFTQETVIMEIDQILLAHFADYITEIDAIIETEYIGDDNSNVEDAFYIALDQPNPINKGTFVALLKKKFSKM